MDGNYSCIYCISFGFHTVEIGGKVYLEKVKKDKVVKKERTDVSSTCSINLYYSWHPFCEEEPHKKGG